MIRALRKNQVIDALPAPLAAIVLLAAGQDIRAQSCDPYYVSLAPLPVQWYYMSWAVHDDGRGRDVYKASFYGNFIERLHEGSWQPVNRTGLPRGWNVRSVFSLNPVEGPRLCVYVAFGTDQAYYRWTGTAWVDRVPVGPVDGYDSVGGHPTMVDLGNGSAMFSVAAPRNSIYDCEVTQWDGQHWTTIGGCNNSVSSLLALPCGQHESLWVVGDFDQMSGVPAKGLANWNAQGWTGFTAQTFRAGYAGAVIANLGDGPKIYAHGLLEGQPREGICVFNGSQWTFLGAPDPLPPPSTPPYITCMGVFDDGRGPALYIGGIFRGFQDVAARNLVRYKDGVYEAVGAGIIGEPSWIGAYQDIRGSAMFVGGDVLTGAGGGVLQQSAAIVIGCQGGQCYANCDLSTAMPKLNINDFMCYINAFARLDPYANCDGSTAVPAINVIDFTCFLGKFAAGCP